MQVAHHLAAVANAQREGVRPREKRREVIAGPRVEEDRLGPPLACPQHVSVGKSAARGKRIEKSKRYSARDQVAHVHVVRVETGAVERRSHLDVAVDALFAQHGDFRARPRCNAGCSGIVALVERQHRRKAGVAFVLYSIELLLRGLRIVAQPLQRMRRGGPRPMQIDARLIEQDRTLACDANARVARRLAHADAAQAGRLERSDDALALAGRYLQNGAQLLAEKRLEGSTWHLVDVDREPAPARKCHFEQCREKPAVRAIVVGEDSAVGMERLHRLEKQLQGLGIVDIGRGVAELAVYLRQRRSAEAIPAVAEVDQHEDTLLIERKQRRQHAPCIGHSCKRGNDQRDRRRHRFVDAVFAPCRAHRHRILADWNAQAKRRTQFHRHCANRFVERCILAAMSGRRHPVGGQLDIAQARYRRRGQVCERLAHRHSSGRRPVDERERRALAHRHRLAGVARKIHERHRDIRHRHLPGPDHRVARAKAAHGPIADGDEKSLVGDRRQLEDAIHRISQAYVLHLDVPQGARRMFHVPRHLGGLTQQHGQIHVDRPRMQRRIFHDQTPLARGAADHREWAALPFAQGTKAVDCSGANRHDVALLCFVAPDLARRHARLFRGNAA